MSKEKNKKAIDQMVESTPIKMPWNVGRFFTDASRQIDFCNEQASFGEDYGSLAEIRTALDWLADQFGGKITWKDNK